MNEECNMSMETRIGPNLDGTGSKEWALSENAECTKMYIENELASKSALPRQKEWACPDKGPLTKSGYAVFDDNSELAEFVSFFEEKNAESIAEIEEKAVSKPKYDVDLRLYPELRVSGYSVYDNLDELKEFVDFFENNNAELIRNVIHDSASKRVGVSNAPVYGGL